MIDHRPNEAGIYRVHLVSRYMVKTDPGTGKPYSGVIEVTYSPSEFLFEPIHFEEKLIVACRGSIRPDALVQIIVKEIKAAINPVELIVVIHVETTAHGSYTVTAGGDYD